MQRDSIGSGERMANEMNIFFFSKVYTIWSGRARFWEAFISTNICTKEYAFCIIHTQYIQVEM